MDLYAFHDFIVYCYEIIKPHKEGIFLDISTAAKMAILKLNYELNVLKLLLIL